MSQNTSQQQPSENLEKSDFQSEAESHKKQQQIMIRAELAGSVQTIGEITNQGDGSGCPAMMNIQVEDKKQIKIHQQQKLYGQNMRNF